MIVTLYKDKFYDGLGKVIELKEDDILSVRNINDNSFYLNSVRTFLERNEKAWKIPVKIVLNPDQEKLLDQLKEEAKKAANK